MLAADKLQEIRWKFSAEKAFSEKLLREKRIGFLWKVFFDSKFTVLENDCNLRSLHPKFVWSNCLVLNLIKSFGPTKFD